jgi:hypothetical protein
VTREVPADLRVITFAVCGRTDVLVIGSSPQGHLTGVRGLNGRAQLAHSPVRVVLLPAGADQ